MPIAAFIGADPRHPPTERAHATQTADLPANEARRLALWRGIDAFPFALVLTPQDIGALRKQAKLKADARDAQIPTAPKPTEPTASDYFMIHADLFAAVGANSDRFVSGILRPFLLERVDVNFATGDPSNSHIQILLRRTPDTTAGLTSDDFDIFTTPDPVVGSVISTTGGAAAGGGHALTIPVGLTITSPPAFFHLRAINIGGGSPLHYTAVLRCRWIHADELARLNPVHTGIAADNSRLYRFPLPPSRVAVQTPRGPRGYNVCVLGFCRAIPTANLAPEVYREITTNEYGGVPTPGVEPIP